MTKMIGLRNYKTIVFKVNCIQSRERVAIRKPKPLSSSSYKLTADKPSSFPSQTPSLPAYKYLE